MEDSLGRSTIMNVLLCNGGLWAKNCREHPSRKGHSRAVAVGRVRGRNRSKIQISEPGLMNWSGLTELTQLAQRQDNHENQLTLTSKDELTLKQVCMLLTWQRHR